MRDTEFDGEHPQALEHFVLRFAHMADHRQIELACELELLVIEEGLARVVETRYEIVEPDLADTHKSRVPHTRGNLLAQHAQIVVVCARREQRVNAERVSTTFKIGRASCRERV